MHRIEAGSVFMEQRFYFNDRIDKAMDKVMDYPVTIVSAPLAFGKSISIEETARRAKERGAKVEWIILHNEEKREYLTYVLEKLEQTLEGEWLYVFDGCEGMDGIEEVLKGEQFHEKWKKEVHCVCIMSHPIMMSEIHLSNRIHSITKDDLELKEKDILRLYQLNGIKISYQSARLLYEYSGGWPGAVMLGIREYFYQRKLVPGAGVDELLEKDFIHTYNQEQEEALFSLFDFQEMKLEQIKMLIGQKEEEQSKIIHKVIDQNPFIEYDIINDIYIVKKVLYYYLKRKIKRLSWVMQRRIYRRRAKWFETQKMFFESMKIYRSLEEYEPIFQYPYELSDLCACVNQEFLTQLWEIMEQSPYFLKCKYTRFPLLSACIFFLWNEQKKGKLILDEVDEIATHILKLSSRQEEQLQGEICLIRSIKYDRNLEEMDKSYERAIQLLRGNSMIYDSGIVWTRGSPSILHIYYSEPGSLDSTVEKLKCCMKKYYELTGDNAMGSDIVMEAEGQLLRCQFAKAKSLAYQAIKIAEKFGQMSIQIAGLFLMVRIYLYSNQYEKVKEYLKEIEKKTEDIYNPELKMEKELCIGYTYTFMQCTEKVPEWICEDHSAKLEYPERLIIFLNVLYLKNLILRKEEQEVIAIGEYIYAQTHSSRFLWAELNIQLTRAVAYHRMGNDKQATELMKQVLDLAIPDKIYFPIIAYYMELIGIFELLFHIEEYRESIEEIMEIYNNAREIRVTGKKQEEKEKNVYGLTNRELEIAMLGAKRYSNNEIAKRLYISENTVKYNMKHIFQKLSIKSRLELKEFFKE